MKFLSKVHLTFSLSDRFFNESHSNYIERVIAEAKKQVSLHDVDVFEMTGSMYQSDINIFKEKLGTDPISSHPTTEPHQYSVTFLLSAEKLLNKD